MWGSGDAGHRYRARLPAFNISASGIGMVGVPLEEGFDSHQQNIILPGSDIIDDEQIELQAKLLNYFLGSNKSHINQRERVPRSCGWGWVAWISRVISARDFSLISTPS